MEAVARVVEDGEYCLEVVGCRSWRRESGAGSTGEVEEGIVMRRRVLVRWWEEWEADAGDRKTRR
jgi:hypothetical protein